MDTERNLAEQEQSEAVAPPGPAQGVLEDTPPAPAQTSMTPEEIEKLKAEAAKARDNWMRTAADLENYKKRAVREREEVRKFANESLLERLIPVLDAFESALAKSGPAQSATVESLQTGIKMIQQQLKTALAEAGMEEIDAAGKPFDPHCHEALSQQERADLPEGQVVQQLRKGYKLRDRLVRPAAVVVSKKPAKSSG